MKLAATTLAAAVAALALAGCSAESATTPASPPYVPPPPPPIVKTWGEDAVTGTGVRFRIDAPERVDGIGPTGKPLVNLRFTVVNGSQQDSNSVGFAESRTNIGHAGLGYASTGRPSQPATLRPGEQATSVEQLEIDPNATELRITLATGTASYTGTAPIVAIHFTGPIPAAGGNEPAAAETTSEPETATPENSTQGSSGGQGLTCDLDAPVEINANHEITNRACGYTDDNGNERSHDPWIDDQLKASRGEPSPYQQQPTAQVPSSDPSQQTPQEYVDEEVRQLCQDPAYDGVEFCAGYR